jgi:hypothetical protein
MNTKDSNPKDVVGTSKVSLSCVPMPVVFEAAIAMMEGARKYGRHNYRVAGVRGSIYYDALNRHINAWWEGEDNDPNTGVSHIAHAIACLFVLRDSMKQGNWTDDRPPVTPDGWLEELNAKAAALVDKYPVSVPPCVQRTAPLPVGEWSKDNKEGEMVR